MSDRFITSSRQAAELDYAFERNGWSSAEVKKLSQGEVLANFRRVLLGHAKIVTFTHTINLATPPRLPFDYAEVVKHDGTGIVEIELRSDDNLYIDGKKVVLHLSERQMGDKMIEGHELRKELEDGTHVLLNSNVLDYLYDHPELFPEHWKKDENEEFRHIFFWGSIFRNPFGNLCVRHLCWNGSELSQLSSLLVDIWYPQYLSALVAG